MGSHIVDTLYIYIYELENGIIIISLLSHYYASRIIPLLPVVPHKAVAEVSKIGNL